MKRNVAATAALRSPSVVSAQARQRNRIMKLTRQSKTAAPEPTKARSFADSFSSDEFQWPRVEISIRSRAPSVATILPRRRSAKPHAVLGVNVATGPRGSAGLRPWRPVPFPLSRVPSPHLLGVLVQASLGTAVGTTPVGTLVTKTHSSDCSASAPVDSTSCAIQGSKVSDVAAAANTQLLQQNVKLHPVLGVFVPTHRRGSRCPCPFPCHCIPELLSLFPAGN